jgi:hypothetical protein
MKHIIRWFARFPGTDEDWTPRSAGMSMAANQFGWDVRCSCGWETRTGGAVPRYIRDQIWWHRWDVEHGFESSSTKLNNSGGSVLA